MLMENSPKAHFRSIRAFGCDESGATTVDWVVLTGAIVGIGIAVMVSTSGGALGLAGTVSTSLSETEVNGGGSGGGSGPGFGGAWDEYLDAASGDSVAAREAVEADAPDGHYFSGWIDGATNKPLYTADGGQSFNVGGDTYGFQQYWGSVANGSYPLG